MTDPLGVVEHALANRDCRPKRRGQTITARCPAHDDNNPSLSVGPGTNQPVVLTCHAGCTTPNILHALGLTWADISNDRPTPSALEQTAVYRYEDEHGRHLYDVIRFHPKTFRQRRPDGTWGLGDTRRVLYRLPELAGEETVWIAEGEKDVDAIRAAGEKATCSPMGAGKWTDAYTQQLKDAGIRKAEIVADRDAPGYQHAIDIAVSLNLAGITATIYEPAEGKDVHDHLTAGNTLYDLVNIDPAAKLAELEQAAPDTPPTDPTWDWAHLIDWNTFWDREPADEKWLVWPLVPRGRAVSLYAGAKAGKSTVILAGIVDAVLGRAPYGVQKPQATPDGGPIRVLYLDYEMTQDDLHERLDEMGYGPETNLTNLYYASIPSLGALDEPGQDGPGRLLQLALHLEVDLVVIDTFSRAVAGNENDADTVNRFYNLTGRELKGHGIALLRTDHSGKDVAKGQRGSSAKDGDVDLVFRLVRNDDQISVTRTHSRVTWGVDELKLRKAVSDDGHTIYLSDDRAETYGPGVAELVKTLNELDVPLDATRKQARELLAAAGHGAKNDRLGQALKFRLSEAQRAVDNAMISVPFGEGTEISGPTDATKGTGGDQPTKPQVNDRGPARGPEGTESGSHRGPGPLSKRGPDPRAVPRPPRHNLFDDDYDPAA